MDILWSDIFILDQSYSKYGWKNSTSPDSLFLVCDEISMKIVRKCLELL